MTFRVLQILTTWINSFSSVLIITSPARATMKYFSFISREGMDSGDSWGEGETEREGRSDKAREARISAAPHLTPALRGDGNQKASP